MKRKIKSSTLTILYLLILAACAPSEIVSEILPQLEETVIFSFSLEDGRQVYLFTGENDEYLAFSLGTADSLEYQYPAEPDSTSWQLFDYSCYLRGGGPGNMGMDLNWLTFEIDGTIYTLYDEYCSEDESRSAGLRMESSDNGEVDLEAIPASVTGSLLPLRFDKHLSDSECE